MVVQFDTAVAERLMQDLQLRAGLTREQAAGVVGNLAHESAGFRTLQEIDPVVEGSRGGYGYAQWTGPRRREFEQFTRDRNLSPSSYEANVEFLLNEAEGSEKNNFDAVRRASTAEEAAKIFSDKFLRPGTPHMSSRLDFTRRIAQLPASQLSGSGGSSASALLPPTPRTRPTVLDAIDTAFGTTTQTPASQAQQRPQGGASDFPGNYAREVPGREVTQNRQPTEQEAINAALPEVRNFLSGSRVNLNALNERDQARLVAALPTIQGIRDPLEQLNFLQSNDLYNPLMAAVPTREPSGMERWGAGMSGVELPGRVPTDFADWGVPGGGNPQVAAGFIGNALAQARNTPISSTTTVPSGMNTVESMPTWDSLQTFAAGPPQMDGIGAGAGEFGGLQTFAAGPPQMDGIGAGAGEFSSLQDFAGVPTNALTAPPQMAYAPAPVRQPARPRPPPVQMTTTATGKRVPVGGTYSQAGYTYQVLGDGSIKNITTGAVRGGSRPNHGAVGSNALGQKSGPKSLGNSVGVHAVTNPGG